MSFLNITLFIVVLAVILGLYLRHSIKSSADTSHELFSRLWEFPEGEHTRWEAEYDSSSPYASNRIGLFAEDNYELCKESTPSIEEVGFSKKMLENPNEILSYVYKGVSQGWEEWFEEKIPKDWQSEFIIDGISVPIKQLHRQA